jgi:1A family penicillin-binding protein
MPIRKKYRIRSARSHIRKPIKRKWGSLKFPKFGRLSSKRGLIKKSIAPSLLKKVFKARSQKGTKAFLKMALKAALLFFIVGFIGIAGIFIYFSKDIPNPDKIVDRSVAESTKIYDRTGEHLLYEIHGEEKRTIVKLDQISKHLINATVATEDQDFYKHHGIDFRGIARAIWKDVVNRKKLQGGSTITQQLIKNSILTSERTLTRKIKEAILAIETEQKFSKDQIMEMYLNQIPYGSNAYGIEAAAQTFFGKSAKDLDVSEAALLAALPKATTYYSPYGAHPEALKARYEYIIGRMLEENYISEEEAEEAKKVEILKRVKPFKENIKAPHFVMYVKQKLVDEFGEEKVEKGGLKVYTTLNYDMQLIAEDAVQKGVEKNSEKYNARNAALVAIDPKTGQILSMVGSKDYFNIEEDGNVNVAISNRQPGSSFKPFVYATAFQKGYTPDTILFDVYTNFGKDGSGREFRPRNYNLKFSGPVTMRSALARSLNIPAVKTLYLAGIKNSIQTAHDLGITTLNNPRGYGLSLVLGTGEVKLLDMVSAYGVFANDGQRNMAISILKIEDSSGNILKEFESNPKQVLDVEVARKMNSILSDNAARAPTFGSRSKLYLGNRPVAAKTGTTNDYKDGWTIGYTPSLVAGVWAGNNRGEKMKYAGGIRAAAPIWNDFMSRVLALDPIEKFHLPKKIKTKKPILNGKYQNEIKVKIDKACGDKLANELTPENQIEEKTYLQVHSILYYVNKDDPQGDYPENPEDDPQFANWEQSVLAWAEENASEVNVEPPTEICPLRSEDNLPIIDIVSPRNDQIIKGNKLYIETEVFANLDIKQVEFYFDDFFIGVDRTLPYTNYYNIPSSIEDGAHSVVVRVYDEINNLVQKQISIIISKSSPVYLKPIRGDSFPFSINAVTSGSEIRNVSFYYQLDSVYNADMDLIKKPGPRHEIGKADSPVPGENNLYQILWEEDKEYFILGKYKIFAILEDKNGNLYESNKRFVEIR